jgi:hypothetical protein
MENHPPKTAHQHAINLNEKLEARAQLDTKLEATGTKITVAKLGAGEGWGIYLPDEGSTEIECPECGDILVAEGNFSGATVDCGNDDCRARFVVKLRPEPDGSTLVPVADEPGGK